jgi:hypothetical protein
MGLGGFAIAFPASSPPVALLKSRFSSCPSAAAPVRIPGSPAIEKHGGEGGIRTLEAGISHLRDFQSRSFGQLGHLSVHPGTLQRNQQLPEIGGGSGSNPRISGNRKTWRRGRDSNPRYGFIRTTA